MAVFAPFLTLGQDPKMLERLSSRLDKEKRLQEADQKQKLRKHELRKQRLTRKAHQLNRAQRRQLAKQQPQETL